MFFYSYAHFSIGDITSALISSRKIDFTYIPVEIDHRCNDDYYWHDFPDEFFTVYDSLDEAITSNPVLMKKINHLIIDSHEFCLNEEYENSLASLLLLVDLVGEVPYLMVRIGSYYCDNKEYTLALSYYHKALAANYDLENTYFSIFYIYNALDEVEQEANILLELLKIAPNCKFYNAQLARVYSKLDCFPEAVVCLEKALEAHPDTRYEYGDFSEIIPLLAIIDKKGLQQ